MIKNNPIVKATLALVAFIYICLALYMITQGVSTFKLVSSLLNSIILIIGGTILGFCITLVAISAIKNYQLNLLLKANNNGRYGTTQGYLPQRHKLDADKISLKNDLPESIQEWVKTNEVKNNAAIDLFIILAGILKTRLNLYADGSNSITLYAHSIKVSERLITLSSQGSEACNAFLIENGYLTPNNMKMKYIEELVNSQVLALIGIMHDIGKVNSFMEKDGVTSYLDNHPQKAKLIVSAIDCFWELDEDIRDSLLFATAYYNNFANCPKIVLDKKLVAKYVRGELLVQLLIAAHNEVASYEILQYQSVESKAVTASKPKVDEFDISEDSEKLALNAKEKPQPEAVNIPKPKKRYNAKSQDGKTVTKEVANKKIDVTPQAQTTSKVHKNVEQKQTLDNLFAQSEKPANKAKPSKSKTENEEVKLTDLFGAKDGK